MHGTLAIKIFVNQNAQTLESDVNTWLMQQSLLHENYVDLKALAIPTTPPTGVIVIIYKK